jgi:hypothetical protein
MYGDVYEMYRRYKCIISHFQMSVVVNLHIKVIKFLYTSFNLSLSLFFFLSEDNIKLAKTKNLDLY